MEVVDVIFAYTDLQVWCGAMRERSKMRAKWQRRQDEKRAAAQDGLEDLTASTPGHHVASFRSQVTQHQAPTQGDEFSFAES